MPGATGGRGPTGSPGGLFAGVFVLAVALRLLFGLAYWTDKPLTLDEQDYLLLGRSVASGRGFQFPATSPESGPNAHFDRPPLYPLLVAGALVATGHPWSVPAPPTARVPLPRSSAEIPRGLLVAQALVGAAGALLVGALARHALGTRAGVVAAAVAAIEPPLVWSCGMALSEALYSTLALLTAYLLLRVDDGSAVDAGSGAWRVAPAAVAAGVAAGLAVLTREAMLLFVPLAFAWLAARRRWRGALVFAAAVLLALAPWAARNYAEHGRFVLTASHGGVNFWIGNNALARGEGDLAANPDIKRARAEIEAAHAGASAQVIDAVYYAEAFRFIRTRPADWLALEAKKLFYSVVPVGPSYWLHSPLYRLGSWLPYALLLPCALVGLARVGGAWRRLWPTLLLAASAVAVGLVFFPQERYRIPVVDPALIVCAAACLPAAGASLNLSAGR